jgi:GR25 family glycosyltransferase involved in LPS biosynthesis
VRENLSEALVMEDDAMVARDWRESLQKLAPVLQRDPNWNAIFLNASEAASPPNTWVPALEQYLTGAYILSLAGAKWLLSHFGQQFYAADWMTSRLQAHAGHCWTYFPWLVIQEGRESTIGSNVEADHTKVLRLLGGPEALRNYV